MRVRFVPALVGLASVVLGLTPALAQDWRAVPRYGTVTLSSGFSPDPWTSEVDAGGDMDVGHLGARCIGFIDGSKPDYDLNFQAGQYQLSIYAVSSADVSLVVYTPDGRWVCDDDTSGTNPQVLFNNPASGNYNIWVGTHRRGSIVDAVLGVTEGDPVWNTGGSSGGAASIEWGDNTSRWANDGECDDDRFAGPGADETMLAEDRYHDAADCRALYQAGQIYLR